MLPSFSFLFLFSPNRQVPSLCEDLLSSVDQPLKIARDKVVGKDYLLCDYNRDGDSYRWVRIPSKDLTGLLCKGELRASIAVPSPFYFLAKNKRILTPNFSWWWSWNCFKSAWARHWPWKLFLVFLSRERAQTSSFPDHCRVLWLQITWFYGC